LVLPLITKVRAPATWRQRLHPLVELYQRHAHHSTHGQMLAAEILLWAVRTLREDSHHEPALTATQRRLLEFLADWEEASRLRPTAPPAVAHLARQLNLSETGLRDAFHRATGRSPRCYFEERRVERAARLLLATDRSINDVARAEGYEDPYHFSRVFKRVTGRSPRQYRQGIGSPSGSQV
jgi:AraC-like DNA-binding protein